MGVEGLFSALADGTRREVFRHLVEQGPASATELARHLPVSRQAIAKHLSVLGEAGLVERHAAGREIHYAANTERLGDVVRWVAEVGAEWEQRLERLRRRME